MSCGSHDVDAEAAASARNSVNIHTYKHRNAMEGNGGGETRFLAVLYQVEIAISDKRFVRSPRKITNTHISCAFKVSPIITVG